MPNVVWTNLKGPEHDGITRSKIYSFLEKLRDDDTLPGLHIEPIHGQVDPRARTGRVDIHLRAVLYRLDGTKGERTYVYVGTFEHDKGTEYARTRVLDYNPVNGIAELIVATAPAHLPQAEPRFEAPERPASYLVVTHNYSIHQLTDELGFDTESADRLFAAADERAVLAVADSLEIPWQQIAALGLAVGDTIEQIRTELQIVGMPAAEDEESDDDRILRALAHPASKMQFTFVEDDEELRRIIDDGDFGAWRVFLHPEQQRYASGTWSGPFRLTGGAGTGKTVVLLHRTKHLADADPTASIVLTTYTRALAENMKRDLDRLDKGISKSDRIGEPGVLVRGVDQLTTAVRTRAGTSFGTAAAAVFGEPGAKVTGVAGNQEGWSAAIAAAGADLADGLRDPAFFEAEYTQVILPIRVTTEDEYLEVRRLGRRTPLNASKRREVWKVIEEYREAATAAGTITWTEQAAISAAWLDMYGDQVGMRARHVLVDEAQDLTPAHWQFLRALARDGADDLFIAEDTHQRIYGPPVVLTRYGIRIVGRSRRLTLNYRTTEQNLRFAMTVLEGGEYTDSEELDEGVAGYRSARRGPAPSTFAAASDEEQVEYAARRVNSWLDAGVEPATIAILTRTNEGAFALRNGLATHGVAVNVIKSAQRGGDRPVVLTMHTSKGMEFSHVILFDVSEGVVPSAAGRSEPDSDESIDARLRERSLLYVAASRARDVLEVTWKGDRSPLLG